MSALRKSMEDTESENRSGFHKKGGATEQQRKWIAQIKKGILMLTRELQY